MRTKKLSRRLSRSWSRYLRLSPQLRWVVDRVLLNSRWLTYFQIIKLRNSLKEVALGNAFLLQGGKFTFWVNLVATEFISQVIVPSCLITVQR